MTAKETLLQRAPGWSEHDAEVALRAVEREHASLTVDEWGDLNAQTDKIMAGVMRDLDDEERGAFGETIAEAWGYTRRT